MNAREIVRQKVSLDFDNEKTRQKIEQNHPAAQQDAGKF